MQINVKGAHVRTWVSGRGHTVKSCPGCKAHGMASPLSPGWSGVTGTWVLSHSKNTLGPVGLLLAPPRSHRHLRLGVCRAGGALVPTVAVAVHPAESLVGATHSGKARGGPTGAGPSPVSAPCVLVAVPFPRGPGSRPLLAGLGGTCPHRRPDRHLILVGPSAPLSLDRSSTL